MTIDKMILKLKSDAVLDSYNFQGYSREQKNQIAEWLKELKHYQLGDCMNDCEHYDNCADYIYSKGYNKAIDDFRDKICEKYTAEERKENYKQYCCNIKQELVDLAEQLKR